MKANELRKGIFIQDIDTKRKGYITKINGNKLTVKLENSTLIQHFEEFEPIELTKEILLQNGFEKDTFLNYLYHHSEGITLWFRNGEFVCDKNLIQIKYLHKLQNFFFLLKEKELEINL